MIKGCLAQGISATYSLDVFVINLGSQLLLSFTRYGWYLYLLIPGYISYILAKFCWGYLSRSVEAEPETPIDPKEAKRQAKKERQEARGPRVKYLKR
mmetsp:Transcript_31069/g.23106  ORF Transcript_31069/g.23106 Transcript_31069/m.23106 type:complete len:97 (+) Transcript_31069:241-531(+)